MRSSVLFRKFLIKQLNNFNSYLTFISQIPSWERRRGNEASSSGVLAAVLVFAGTIQVVGNVLEVTNKINISSYYEVIQPSNDTVHIEPTKRK
jgi:hypothetical protein